MKARTRAVSIAEIKGFIIKKETTKRTAKMPTVAILEMEFGLDFGMIIRGKIIL